MRNWKDKISLGIGLPIVAVMIVIMIYGILPEAYAQVATFYKEQIKVGGGYGSAAEGESPAGGITLTRDGDLSMDGDAVVGGTLGVTGVTTVADDIIGAVTQDLLDTVSTTINFGGAATVVDIGAATGTTTIKSATTDIDGILTAGTGPTTITNAAGQVLASALETSEERSYAGLWQNTGTGTGVTHTTNTNEFSPITEFVHIGAQDSDGNAVATLTPDVITIGANGGGTYEIYLSASGVGTGTNEDYWIAVANEVATEPVITSSTDETPIVVTMAAAHGLETGDAVVIAGHTTNVALNASHLITWVDATTFSVRDLAGADVAGTGGGAGAAGTITHIINGSCMKARRFANSTDVGSATITGTDTVVAGDLFVGVVGGATAGNDDIKIVSVNMRVNRISN